MRRWSSQKESPSSASRARVSSPKEYPRPAARAAVRLTSAPRQPEASTMMGARKRPSAVATAPSSIPVTDARRKRARHCASRPWQKRLVVEGAEGHLGEIVGDAAQRACGRSAGRAPAARSRPRRGTPAPRAESRRRRSGRRRLRCGPGGARRRGAGGPRARPAKLAPTTIASNSFTVINGARALRAGTRTRIL